MDKEKIIATIEEYKNKLWWYHTIDLGDGIRTPGLYDHRPYLKYYGFPDHLSGKRVLDIGTLNGFFAFEMEERGAEEVVGIDIVPPITANFCKRVRGSKARFLQMSIYDLDPDKMGGPFDLVFCGSLLLHLDDIVGAMRKIRLMTKDIAIVTSAYLHNVGEVWPIFYPYLQKYVVKGLTGPSKKVTLTFPVTWSGNRKAYEKLFEYVGFEHSEAVSTFSLKLTDNHNTDMGLDGYRDTPHIVIRGGVKAMMKTRNEKQGGGIAERLTEIRKEVIGSCPEPKDMEVFRPEESGGTIEEDLNKDFIGSTIQYPIISTRRIVAPIIVFVKRVFLKLLRPVMDQINHVLNTHQINFNRLNESFEYLAARIDSLLEETSKIHEETSKIHEETSQILEKHDERLKQLEELKISQRLNRFERWMRGQDKDEKQTDRESHKAKKGEEKAEISRVDLPGMDYYLFEERFRGDEKLIADRQHRYMRLFRNSDKVLDIGCGRGEFLEILKKNKVSAYGIDLNEDMVRLCKEKGLEVYKEDALSHLERIAPDTLGGIFLAQVVEHLSPEELLRLIHLSFSRLKGGGLFVAETLNPGSLSAMELFYLDPSHIRPFPSKTFEFLLETAGFSNIRIDFLNPASEQLELMRIQPNMINKLQRDQLEQINKNLKRLNERLFGPIDYAIIASKKGND